MSGDEREFPQFDDLESIADECASRCIAEGG